MKTANRLQQLQEEIENLKDSIASPPKYRGYREDSMRGYLEELETKIMVRERIKEEVESG